MKIVSIEAVPYNLPTVRPHKLAMATITEHTLVLVRIRDDEGREGLGEAAVIPHYGAETQHGICDVIDEVLTATSHLTFRRVLPPCILTTDAVRISISSPIGYAPMALTA